MKEIDKIITTIQSIRMSNVFNPYIDICPLSDSPDSAQIRSKNLAAFLTYAKKNNMKTMWLGRDLGYRGGRRTGIAFTDDISVLSFNKTFINCKVNRATIGPMIKERSASEIWKALKRVPELPFLWNAFPLHPFKENQPQSNRKHDNNELMATHQTNLMIIKFLEINRIIAIGNDAGKYASKTLIETVTVRHPSYGGTEQFHTEINEAYQIKIPDMPLTEQGTLLIT